VPIESNKNTNDNPNIEIKQTYTNLSNKWVWMLAIIPTIILLIVPLFGLYPDAYFKNSSSYGYLYYDYVWYPVIFLCISLLVTVIFVFIDSKELKRNGINGNWWIIGFFLIPVFLYMRAKKTTNKFNYVICWGVLFILFLVMYLYFAILGN